MTTDDRIEPFEVAVSVTPGLVVHLRDASPLGVPRWHVVHEDSGQPLRALVAHPGEVGPEVVGLDYDTEAQAVAVADALAGLTDWRVTAYDLEVAATIADGSLLYAVGAAAMEASAA